ncbi:MAG: ATP-binding protein [Chloroflexota bacterium]
MSQRARTVLGPSILGERRLTALLRALAPGDEEALRHAAQTIAAWDEVSAVSIDVAPGSASGERLTAVAGIAQRRRDLDGAAVPLLDRGQSIGALSVLFDDAVVAPARREASETLAALVAPAAARWRLDARLLEAQSYEVTGQIAAGLVHDFNNMLTGIAGNASIAHALLAEDDRALVPVVRIEDAARAATVVARALLQFVRGSLGCGLLSVNEVAMATERVLSRAMRDGIEVRLDLGMDVPPVEGEQVLLQQALVNLVLNGAQAIEGDGAVTIGTRRASCVPGGMHGQPRPATCYAALSVTDTGRGIPPEHVDSVFQPFFTTKGKEGTGLGLPSVVQVARRHGGAVAVESRPGAGTTFTMYLPAASGGGTSIRT